MGCLRLTYNEQQSPLRVVHRKSDPAQKVIQRFISVDPLADDPRNVSWSPYAYTWNNPLKYTDPTGMIGETIYEDSEGNQVEVNDGVDKVIKVSDTDFETAKAFAEIINPYQENASNTSTGAPGDIVDMYNDFYNSVNSYDKLSIPNAVDYVFGGPNIKSDQPIGGTIPLLGGPAKGVTSLVKQDARLLKLARQTFKGNSVISKEANSLIGQLNNGNLNPGIGTKTIGKNIFEARSRGGARVYFRSGQNGTEILGYSNKANQSQVIKRILEIY